MGVFSELKPKNSARKNPFDLSAYVTFNQKAGMIVPLKYWPTLPNSEYKLDLKALLRTQPLSTAAFAGFSINYDVVWTPYNDHYSSFNQFIAQRLNKQHTTQPDIEEIPKFNLGSFVRLLIAIGIYDSFCADYGYQNYRRFLIDETPQCPWYLLYSRHLPEESIALSCLRTLDMLEYGNYLGYLKLCKNAIMDYLDGMTYTVPANKNYPYFVRYLALVEQSAFVGDKLLTTMPAITNFNFDGIVSSYLDHAYHYIFASDTNLHPLLSYSYDINILHDISDSQYVDLWPVMSYNKAFWQFYRNEYYDIVYKYFVWNENSYVSSHFEYVYLFNFDDYSTQLDPAMNELDDDGLRLLAMFAVKPHQYKKDLFTGLLPSTQYGSVSFATSTSSDWFKLISNYHDSSFVSVNSGQVAQSTASGNPLTSWGSSASHSVYAEQFKTDPAIMVSMLELRKADSLQRFRERMLRAGNKTKDIFEAHGWEQPMSEKAFEVQFFGSFDGRLDLNVVASTGEFGSGEEKINLGQLAANGVGAIGGQTIHFKSHDFGTLLVVAYITKDAIYDAYGVNKSHTLLEAFDFPYPELQNISLAPVTQKQLNCIGLDASALNGVLGYLPQNMAYKTANDLVHGEFFSALPLQPNGQERIAYPQGIFANMVTPRQDINVAKQLSFFYIQPSCVDNVFVLNSNGNQDTDQFFTNVRLDLKCVQPLDVIGLPI